jgi:hypothetical protein
MLTKSCRSPLIQRQQSLSPSGRRPSTSFTNLHILFMNYTRILRSGWKTYLSFFDKLFVYIPQVLLWSNSEVLNQLLYARHIWHFFSWSRLLISKRTVVLRWFVPYFHLFIFDTPTPILFAKARCRLGGTPLLLDSPISMNVRLLRFNLLL